MDPLQILRSADELTALVERSHRQPVFLLKHSLTCPISSSAYHEYLRFLRGSAAAKGAGFGLIEIQSNRPLSNQVTEMTGIRHESPQAILFAGGKPVWDASHDSITERSLASALAGAG